MATAVIMPKQGQSVESCILTELRKKKGDKVEIGDILFAYETDKASFEEEAKVSGEVLDVFFGEGDEIPVLVNVMVIGQSGESIEEFRNAGAHALSSPEIQKQPQADKIEPAAPKPQQQPAGHSSGISPRAKGLAEKYAVDTAGMNGSGPDGRIISRDVISSIETTPKSTPLAKAMLRQEGLQSPAQGYGLGGMVRGADLMQAGIATAGEETIKPLSNMRKLIAKAMHASLQNSAQLTHHLGADARRMLELRKKAKASGSDITINDMVCFAVVKALLKFPQVNSHFLGESVKIFGKVHLALAVDTERGLMVPVVRNASDMTIKQLAAQMKQVAQACKKGSVNPDLLSPEAASFTVSNLGNYGVEIFTPVINLPQTAILGVNTILPRPKDIGDGIYAFVPHIGLSLTYDHRALDGGEATRFVKQIAIEIENLEIEL